MPVSPTVLFDVVDSVCTVVNVVAPVTFKVILTIVAVALSTTNVDIPVTPKVLFNIVTPALSTFNVDIPVTPIVPVVAIVFNIIFPRTLTLFVKVLEPVVINVFQDDISDPFKLLFC